MKKSSNGPRPKRNVTFKDGIDVIGFSDTESKMAPVVVVRARTRAQRAAATRVLLGHVHVGW